jgi:hypothetical protein
LHPQASKATLLTKTVNLGKKYHDFGHQDGIIKTLRTPDIGMRKAIEFSIMF